MYGTVARMRVKPGMETQFEAVSREIGSVTAPGQVAVYAYQMDSNSHEFFLAVIFESRKAYVANAQSPEQNARFMKLMSVLASEPEWHDGEIIYSSQA